MNLLCVFLGTVTVVGLASAQDHAAHQEPPARGGETTARHIPPDPPAHAMRDMSEREMIELMDMDDNASFFMVRANAFEWRRRDSENAFSWDIQGWYGNDYDKLVLKSDGDVVEGDTDARTELLWDRVIGRWWNVQAGIRHDTLPGRARTWAAIGVQGLAPYWFDVEATAYVGEEGRSALRLSIDYELLLTQRLVLEPEVEVEAYGQNDRANLIGSGVSSTELAIRMRYELMRELAPYIGIAWTRLHGNTAQIARTAGVEVDDLQWLAGVRWWF
jgi:copper resistance protein B